ncbi:ribosomal protein L13e [Candidatus Bathyarchaeota archaeon]|nr:ribosomal protein L13e [Candidatus Bathyarchaeota archaeon]MBS7613396.1 ribosomal protein L13e [Candidatus Bathyarchaeota archaeon]MBS7617973.1 ribosomal protein L13e [Candidatus Bathyarchaeota archaeon]
MSVSDKSLPKPVVKIPKVGYGFREGRGFSIGELKEAGLSIGKARMLGLYVDTRRRSIRKDNVEALKQFLKTIEMKTAEAKAKTETSQSIKIG